MLIVLSITIAKILFILAVTLGFFAPILTWVERKQSAMMQDRVGANRADIMGFTVLGLFHIVSDAIKMFTKEDFIPDGANKFVHTISPIIAFVPALLTFAVIPFGGQYDIFGQHVNLVISDLDVGLLFVFAIASIATYGYVLAGWSSNSNWSLLGAMRTASQMISYEVAMGLTIIGVIMVYGSLKLTVIGAAQEDFFRWGIFLQPLGFVMFMAASIAENKRIPFDNPEAESELVAGYFTEYSGIKFGMFFMAEFIEMVTIGAIVTILFFGAWHLPFVTTASLLSAFDFLGDSGANIVVMFLQIGVFFTKVVIMIWIQMTIRWTLPRFRYDQIMKLGWKILLPLSLANVVVTGIVMLI